MSCGNTGFGVSIYLYLAICLPHLPPECRASEKSQSGNRPIPFPKSRLRQRHPRSLYPSRTRRTTTGTTIIY
ncbi:hypothetical protein C8Q77DRAFT_1118796 [Trametes polyzona]|nr:hypothetical protein C8Q77DRAFT_1118796 [Trametes polyzona]